ncbi:MAG: sulfatase-like hydrolase/transferase [Verrucomicrobiota bacterium]
MNRVLLTGLAFCFSTLVCGAEKKQPNIIIYFADDISARELPLYGSSVWCDGIRGGDTSDPAKRASTPVLDRLSEEGVWVTNAWAATICSPSRAMMMTGRHAHRTKWWNNKDRGVYKDPRGRFTTWPLYESSPILISHVANEAGYATFWTGKTQMVGPFEAYGFHEGAFTPGNWEHLDNPYTDFRLLFEERDGQRLLINDDTDEQVFTYKQHGWNFFPHVKVLNHPANPGELVWWPNTPEARAAFDVTTYGPDVEQDLALNFMDRAHAEGKPFLIYHTSHLGHDAFDWLNPDSDSKWPGTPVIEWDGQKYTRAEVKITGDDGEYDTHGTVTEPGMHSHLNYIDYQIWRYLEKLEAMGEAENTIIIFTSDNGTSGFGKNSPIQQRGAHVPFIVYSPGMTKSGKQDALVSLTDVLPTIAELVGCELPADYEIDGESLVPFLFGEEREHRKWVYSFRGPEQFIRGKYVLKDGAEKWWDVSNTPNDLTSFAPITNWNQVSEVHLGEREKLEAILPVYDLYFDEHEAPGIPNRFPKINYRRKAE